MLFLFDKYRFLALILVLIFAASCQKSQIKDIEKEVVNVNEKASQSTSSPFNDERFNYDEINRNLEEFALALAKEMANPEIRKLIKTEAMKQFDGDYDILYKNFKNLKMQNGLSIEEHLQQKNRNVRTQASKIPKFQISVPVNCEGWDTDNYIPLVIIAPQAQGIIERDIKQLKAFDHKGNVYFIDGQKVPDKPVIVLGRSERTDLEGNVHEGYLNTSKDNYLPNGRPSSSMEYLGRLYMSDVLRWEEWIQGALDLRLTISATQTTGQSLMKPKNNAPYSAGRECVQDHNGNYALLRGCYMGDFLFTWDQTYNSKVYYTWIEEDGGFSDPKTFNLNFTLANQNIVTFNVTIPKFNLDDDFGTHEVTRTEPSGQRYGSTSVFEFQVNY
ncbi:MAG: hypothetical protein OHK0057_37290 [Thermoflexibacter sp.]